MSAMMQAFYWDCPRHEARDFDWWNAIRERVPELAAAGFTSLWLPPAHKAASIGGPSMGYDPYDYYDLGEFDQKGSVNTWFGSKEDLLALIAAAHRHGVRVLADMVINHNSGADELERNPVSGENNWTLFRPRSGRFPRNWECFHPNRYEAWDHGNFGGMPDLSHRNPYVYAEILDLARWLIEEIGFDGFRYDYVKGYGHGTVEAIQEYRYERDGQLIRPYGVAEHWSGAEAIGAWAGVTNFSNENPVDAFDFPLRELLKHICDTFGFSLRHIVEWDCVLRRQPAIAVTFVENHDLRDSPRPILHDKLLAYSFIFSHEGVPCVYWKDYYNDGLRLAGSPHGIDALLAAHDRHAGGSARVIWADDDLYIMERGGFAASTGLVYVLNNRGDRWNGRLVRTSRYGVRFAPVAWWSAGDPSRPRDQVTASDGSGEFWAPPRGYAIYAPVD